MDEKRERDNKKLRQVDAVSEERRGREFGVEGLQVTVFSLESPAILPKQAVCHCVPWGI